MCIAFFGLDAFGPDSQLLFLLAFGRDEFINRPSAPVHAWEDLPGVIAGRDLQAGGTWCGVCRHSGRVAWLTNLRAYDPDPGEGTLPVRTRGGLVTEYLTGKTPPFEALQAINGDEYYGFNMVTVDLGLCSTAGSGSSSSSSSSSRSSEASARHNMGGSIAAAAERGAAGDAPTGPCLDSAQSSGKGAGSGVGAMAYRANRAGGSTHNDAQQLEPSRIYGLSNGLLGEWPKVEAGVAAMQRVVSEPAANLKDRQLPWDRLFTEVLGDTYKQEEMRPSGTLDFDTPSHMHYVCSSRFIEPVISHKHGPYGTRSQMVLAVWRDGHAELRERYLDASTLTWRETPAVVFSIPQQQQQQQRPKP